MSHNTIRLNNYYASTQINNTKYGFLENNVSTDCCIIGGGIAGLSLALELVEKGQSVCLLEQNHIAWGASGRNGGFVFPGFAQGMSQIEKRVGTQQSKEMYQLSMGGVEAVRNNIQRFNMQQINVVEGQLEVVRHLNLSGLTKQADYLSQFDIQAKMLDKSDVQSLLHSEKYYAGLYVPSGFHFHPLNYCLQLAQAITAADGQIYENTPALRVNKTASKFTVSTEKGSVNCKKLIYCTGGYTGNLQKTLRRSIIPITTYVLASKPMGPKLREAINCDWAILDDRRAGDYYRVVDGDRLIWGGRITTRRSDPKHLGQLMLNDLLDVYPQLKGIEVESVWSGKMGYATHCMPQIGQLNNDAWYCSAFGGHGLNTAPMAAKLIAEAIVDKGDRFKMFNAYGLTPTGGVLGTIAVQLAYWKYQIEDRVTEYGARVK